jgi:excisionase family DNA binding protein
MSKQKALSSTATIRLPEREAPPSSKPASGRRPTGPVPDLSSHQLLTTTDVAIVLKVSERHVQELYLSGKLRKVDGLGRSVRFRPSSLLAFLETEVA